MNRRTMLRTSALALLLMACGRTGLNTSDIMQDSAQGANGTPPDGPLAPDLIGGGTWLNSEPLMLTALRGKVVLVDFWTYGCINCRNTFPAMRAWWQRYRDQGLVIIGVHTPEFASEHETENLRAAIVREQISWPVVQDNDYKIWQAYGNHYWPHVYLIDHRGIIIYDRIGEGAYDITEQKIVAALAAAHA